MSNIFISYSSEDRDKAKDIAEALEQHGFSVWWDRSILPGETFDAVIEEALNAANCVIVLWSHTSVSSDWVKAEASEGKQRGILIPILIDEVKMPLAFRQMQFADLRDWDGTLPHPGFDSLSKAVAGILDRSRAVQPGQEIRANEAAKKRHEEEERLRREQEERERLRREEQERLRKEAEEKKAREEAEERARKEQERLQREEEERKERERKAREEQERKRQEQERLYRKEEEKKARKPIKIPKVFKGTSRTKIFAVIIVLSAILLGYLGFTALSHNDALTVTPADLPTYTNSIGMEFVLIPAGAFEMGSPWYEANRYDHEGPVHQVTIKKAFYMGRYEVTQAQWRAVMGSNPSDANGDDLPVESVSWDDVQEFIKKLNAKEGTDKYRLPSEAEWEYACRAGTTTRFSFGKSDSNLGEYAWYSANSGIKTHSVGQKKPNPWGLYDMHGNVREYVQDVYHDSYKGAPADGSAWESGDDSFRVFRGSCYGDGAQYSRSAYRYRSFPDFGSDTFGFRLVGSA